MDLQAQIKLPIADELAHFVELFDRTLDSTNATLHEVYSHLLKSKGKLMRPTLMLLLAKGLGGVTDETYSAALSLELLHTASLVHDDIVDDSRERRGQLSVNALFGNKVAVLSGDYILAQALGYAAQTGDARIVKAIAGLGKHLSEGELLQLYNIGSTDYDENTYLEIITKKTASLFATCTRCAAISAGAGVHEVAMCDDFGRYIGLAFQIRDDIFDYSDHADIGKPTGNDMKERKLTLPALFVLNASTDTRLHDMARLVRRGEATDAQIASLVAATVEGGGIEYATTVMQSYVVKAKSVLDVITDDAVRRSLELYADYVARRDH